MRVTYVGHATILIEIDGMRLLTDPVLCGRIAHLKRHSPAPAPALTDRIDAVLISHVHPDHLDRRSLQRLDPEVPVFAPLGAARLLKRLGRLRVTELTVGEEIGLGGLRLGATEAVHEGRRGPVGTRAEAIGYEIAGTEERLYFAGDTDLFPAMAGLAGPPHRPLDLALLPVWGWGARLGPGHLDPESAAAATAILRPRVAVPIHWGTLYPFGFGRWADTHLREPPARFSRAVAAAAPQVEVRVLSPGGRPLELPPPRAD
ncbi:MAG TPA: MBL fold metallo-hydrolase [Solirubrobacterales bacterium]|nr:MBL fold metallo-hydrolase [Solirubrobacterales bacterium]